jgi:hypothetical protein
LFTPRLPTPATVPTSLDAAVMVPSADAHHLHKACSGSSSSSTSLQAAKLLLGEFDGCFGDQSAFQFHAEEIQDQQAPQVHFKEAVNMAVSDPAASTVEPVLSRSASTQDANVARSGHLRSRVRAHQSSTHLLVPKSWHAYKPLPRLCLNSAASAQSERLGIRSFEGGFATAIWPCSHGGGGRRHRSCSAP